MTIFFGVLSGVLTAGFLWVLSEIWRKSIRPAYESYVYKGITIQGTWQLDAEPYDGAEISDQPWHHVEMIELVQKATVLSGTATFIPKYDNDNSVGQITSVLSIEGDVSDRFVTLAMRSPQKNRLSYSVLLLEIVADGNKLKGSSAWYDVNEEKIRCEDVSYTRGNI